MGVARAAVEWEERLRACGGGDGEIGAAGRRVKEHRKAVEALGGGEIPAFCGTSDPKKSHKESHPVKL